MLKVLRCLIGKPLFRGSARYWEHRYARGATSGHGSYGEYARFKADFLNRFVLDNKIASIVELGCGDGNQLSLAKYPRYVGIDISPTAIKLCSERFRNDNSKTFYVAESCPTLESDLAISLDVTYHLVEDDVFSRYMRDLFSVARRFVIIYTSDPDHCSRPDPHVLHRPISKYVAEHFTSWKFEYSVDNPLPEHPTKNFAKFLIFSR
jgi:SAM-dependent methyltransferase